MQVTAGPLLINGSRGTLSLRIWLMNRILLQDFETGLYLGPEGTWTGNPEMARDFPNTVQATETKLRRHLREAFVIVLPQPRPRARRARTRPPDFATRVNGRAKP